MIVSWKTLIFFLAILMVLPAVSAAEKRYQAVYINPDDLSMSYARGSSLEEASRIAAESCGSGCRRAGYSYDACLALAIADDDGTCWGSDWGNSISEAKRKATRLCRDRGAVVRWYGPTATDEGGGVGCRTEPRGSAITERGFRYGNDSGGHQDNEGARFGKKFAETLRHPWGVCGEPARGRQFSTYPAVDPPKFRTCECIRKSSSGVLDRPPCSHVPTAGEEQRSRLFETLL
jgi:hypothetical protein